MNRFITLFVILSTCLLAKSQTPFSNAILKLQDGGDMPLLDVPWFKNQVTMWTGKHSFYSNDYFIVYSAPKSCPSAMSFSYAYAFERGGARNPREFLKNDKKYGEVETLKQCNTYLLKQIIDLSDDIKEKCKCKKVMQTIKHASNNNDDSIWESLDDEILSNHEMIFRFNISSQNKKEPILFSLGSDTAGIYDVHGNKLCSYDIPIKLEFNINYIKKIRTYKYKINCINDLTGAMDLSDLNFSFLQGDLVGEIKINFNNGEQYVIKK